MRLCPRTGVACTMTSCHQTLERCSLEEGTTFIANKLNASGPNYGPHHIGWICPACGAGNAPWNSTCPCKVNKSTKSINVTLAQD